MVAWGAEPNGIASGGASRPRAYLPDMSSTTPDLQARAAGALLGLAVGDALGTTVEFRPRGTFQPVTDMVGGGPFDLPPGAWTDDTSMALCLAHSLLETGTFDPGDQMDRYVRWWRSGYLSSTGSCFDIGNTVASALGRYIEAGDPMAGSTDPRTAGNGCIMRLAPVPIFWFPDIASAIHWSGESARTTHAAPECIDACRLLGAALSRALAGAPRDAVTAPPWPELTGAGTRPIVPRIRAIADGGWRDKSPQTLRGSGYVVDSLEAALWCFHRSATFAESVLAAVNLGDDADTTAAVCGQLAGAHYGVEAIPADWRARVHLGPEIERLALGLLEATPAGARG